MPYIPNLSPNLKEIMEKGKRGDIELLLKDGREVSCKLDCLTYVNRSDEDDADVPAVMVIYRHGGRELLAEDDIEKIL